MSDVIAAYDSDAKNAQSAIAWLAQLQQHGREDFARAGFPTRHDEEWKYTRLDAFLKQNYSANNNTATADNEAKSILPELKHCFRVNINNGCIAIPQANKLPQGAWVKPLHQAAQEHGDLLQAHLGRLLQHEHGFQALNTAVLNSGVVIYLPENVQLAEPILLAHFQNQAGQSVHARHVIIAEKNARATVIEAYYGKAESDYLTNTVSEAFVGERACVTQVKIQEESLKAYHMGHAAAKVGHEGEYHHHSLSFGGRLVRSDLMIDLVEPKAQASMNGIYLPGENQHVDHHTTVHHRVPECHSDQDYKGILAAKSRAVFNGKVIVEVDAQKTIAHQQNKNLLLAANAEIDTKPQLEIFADDVSCTHGATVGQLDEDALFYLASRGIEPLQATRYLVQGFLADNVRRIGSKALADWALQRINQVLR